MGVPFYEYRRPDGTTFEVMQKMSDDPLTHDPETGVPVERVFSPIAIHFKGKGFYNTDYGTKKRNREKASEKSSTSSSDSSSGSSDSSSSSGSSDSVVLVLVPFVLVLVVGRRVDQLVLDLQLLEGLAGGMTSCAGRRVRRRRSSRRVRPWGPA